MRTQVNIQSSGKAIATAKILRNKKKTQLTARKKSASINKGKNGSGKKT